MCRGARGGGGAQVPPVLVGTPPLPRSGCFFPGGSFQVKGQHESQTELTLVTNCFSNKLIVCLAGVCMFSFPRKKVIAFAGLCPPISFGEGGGQQMGLAVQPHEFLHGTTPRPRQSFEVRFRFRVRRF